MSSVYCGAVTRNGFLRYGKHHVRRYFLVVAAAVVAASAGPVSAGERLDKQQTIKRGNGICHRLDLGADNLRQALDDLGEPYPGYEYHAVARKVDKAADRMKQLGRRTGHRGRLVKRLAEGFRLEAIRWRSVAFYYGQGERRAARRRYNDAYAIALRRGDNADRYPIDVCGANEYLEDIGEP